MFRGQQRSVAGVSESGLPAVEDVYHTSYLMTSGTVSRRPPSTSSSRDGYASLAAVLDEAKACIEFPGSLLYFAGLIRFVIPSNFQNLRQQGV
jgi:hypothetical protein